MNFPHTYPGLSIGDASKGVLCEVFVDFCCPYSRKMFRALGQVNSDHDTYTSQMAFQFHHVLQPWHHQSLWLHESALVVKILYPEAHAAYWKALFEYAPNWYDKNVYSLTRGDFYDKIATFCAGVIVANSENQHNVETVKSRILQYLIPPLQPGGNFPPEAQALLGSGPQDDENAVFPLTRQIVKFQRKRGVHVTPTVFFNGIEQTQISSSWSVSEWKEFLDQALART